jgi:peroxiredoxin
MRLRHRHRPCIPTAALILAAVCLFGSAATPGSAAAPADFKLKDLSGGTFQLSDHLGEEVIYISFWATWCVPCRREMPHLQELYNDLKDQGFLVVSVNTDPASNKSKIKPWIARYDLTFPVVLDPDNNVHDRFNPPRKLPYGVLIARDGTIYETYPGYRTGDEIRLREEVMKLLDAGADQTDPGAEHDG